MDSQRQRDPRYSSLPLQRMVNLLVIILATKGCMAGGPSVLKLVGKDVLIESPGSGVRVVACAYYTRPAGLDMICRYIEQTKSDKADVAYQRFSTDNGRTWSAPTRMETFKPVAGGTLRRGIRQIYVDPETGILIAMILQGTLPTDHPLEGMKHWTLRYGLSRDGGRSFYHEEPVVQRGEEYGPDHPLEGVWVGRNSAMIGDTTCAAIRIRTGEILQPIQITPIGPDGEYYNPGGGLTYHDAAVLIARWNDAGTLEWDLSARVKGDPTRSTRGMLEPTIAEMPDGRILMVMRGSNDRKPKLPGRRWYAFSTDHGRTWTQPKPWTYADGKPFFSPSSCSQLLRHSNGRLYWIGNISPHNPRGNRPRYPLVIGEVDRESMRLIEETIITIEKREPDDPDWLAISNFYAHEDRLTVQIVVYCSPIGKRKLTTAPAETGSRKRPFEWTSDACIYRIDVRPTRHAPPEG